MGLCKKLFKLICASIAVFVGVLLGPSPLPNTAKFSEFEVTPLKNYNLVGNAILNNAEKLFEGEVKGPEAFEVVNGELYTTLHGGFVVKVFEDQIVPVVKFGQPCVGWYEESKCGRPLGIKAFGNDHLIVADAYYGIFKYNIKTKQSVNLVSQNQLIDGKAPKIFNGVEVGKDGTIYWTHSSSDFTIQDGVYTFLADGSGRVIKYDPVTNTHVVLLKDLFFPNGIVLSPNEDHLLISETGQSRILKFHLKGPKQFATEVFMDGLPGAPDNLRKNGNNGYFIPLVITRDEKNPLLFQVFSNFPSVRKFAARFLSLIEYSLEEIDKIYPNYYAKRAIHFIGHLESIGIFLDSKATILSVDLNGNLVTSFHGNDGIATSISDVIPHNGYLYLGSPTNNYLARVDLTKLNMVQPSAPFEATHSPKTTTRPPTTTTVPPPTTTSRPTTKNTPPTTSRPTTTTTSRPITTTTPPTTRPPPPTTRPPPPTTQRPSPPPPRQNEGHRKTLKANNYSNLSLVRASPGQLEQPRVAYMELFLLATLFVWSQRMEENIAFCGPIGYFAEHFGHQRYNSIWKMPSVLLTESLALELEGQEQWPEDVKLYQPDEENQILLPDYANCLAVQAFLKINSLGFEIVQKKNAEFMSPSGKVPFLRCGAFLISEFEPIVSFVTNKGIGTSKSLEKSEWSDMRAYMSLVNNVLLNAELYMCWHEKTIYESVTWNRYSSIFSWPINYVITWQKKRAVNNKLGVLGWTKKTVEQVLEDVKNCCHSLSERLDRNPYFFGNTPTELDALVFGHLFSILTTPLPGNDLSSVVSGFPNLIKMCKRLEKEYFSKSI